MTKFRTFSEYTDYVIIDCSLSTLSAVNGLDENRVDEDCMRKSATLRYKPCDKTPNSMNQNVFAEL